MLIRKAKTSLAFGITLAISGLSHAQLGGLPVPTDALGAVPGVGALPGLGALPSLDSLPLDALGGAGLPSLDGLPVPGLDALPIPSGGGLPGLDALPVDPTSLLSGGLPSLPG
ncbi:MAG: hypothetical protein R3221_04675, partial [Spongiibacter sp.]|nr:hypothetical protein [Spongiibacter sp.]